MRKAILLMITTSFLSGCGNENLITQEQPVKSQQNNLAKNNTIDTNKQRVNTENVTNNQTTVTSNTLSNINKDQNINDNLKLNQNLQKTENSKTIQSIFSNHKQVNILFFPTYGNDKEVNVKGRVLEAENISNSNSSDSKLKNFLRNIDILKNDEIKNLSIDINLNGKVVRAITDDEGIFNVKIKDFGQIKTGYGQVFANLSKDQSKYMANQAVGKVTIQNYDDKAFGVVSDIDDTIKKSYVTDKLKAAKTLLFENYTTQEKFVGTPELYQALDKASDGSIDGDIYYISGSPMQLSGSIESFLDYNHFPQGSVDLKRMGLGKNDDSLLQQIEYKLGKLRTLFETYPNKKFILFGDSGEKDPEIYKQISKEYPGRVIAIYINNVTSDDAKSSRYEGIHLTIDASESSLDLYQQGIISYDDYKNIKNTIK